jgi:VWFA-related protein
MRPTPSIRDVLLFCSVVACCFATNVYAQTATPQGGPPAPDDTPFKIQVKVDAVLIPVVVRDAKGHAVGTLRKEDFQLFDRDKPKPISGFTLQMRAPAKKDVSPDAMLPGKSGGSGSAAPGPSAGVPERSIIFLFDDLHLTANDLPHVQDAAIKMLKNSLAESDRAAVVSFTGTHSALTNDRAKLQETILKLHSRNLYNHATHECPDIDFYKGDLIENKSNQQAFESAVQDMLTCANMDPSTSRNIAEHMVRAAASRAVEAGDQDVRVTLGFLKELIHKIAALPGQRTLILISPGFLTVTPEALNAKSEILDFAAQNNVTISTLESKGLYTSEIDASERGPTSAYALRTGVESDYHRESLTLNEDVLAELADGTGGTYFHNNNDLTGGLKNLTDGPEYVYLLEMPLDEVKPDGTYHHLKVKVDQKGLKLQARQGYFAPALPKEKKQK